MDSVEQELYSQLGFKVEDGQVKTFAQKKNIFNKDVPQGVRPATKQEILLWDALVSSKE